MFLKLNKSLISNNTTKLTKSSIWITLIPSRHELPDDINNFDNNENEEDDDDNDNGDENDDLSPLPVESEEADYTHSF